MIIALLTLGACNALEGEFQNVLSSRVRDVGIGAWSQCAGASPNWYSRCSAKGNESGEESLTGPFGEMMASDIVPKKVA